MFWDSISSRSLTASLPLKKGGKGRRSFPIGFWQLFRAGVVSSKEKPKFKKIIQHLKMRGIFRSCWGFVLFGWFFFSEFFLGVSQQVGRMEAKIPLARSRFRLTNQQILWFAALQEVGNSVNPKISQYISPCITIFTPAWPRVHHGNSSIKFVFSSEASFISFEAPKNITESHPNLQSGL